MILVSIVYNYVEILMQAQVQESDHNIVSYETLNTSSLTSHSLLSRFSERREAYSGQNISLLVFHVHAELFDSRFQLRPVTMWGNPLDFRLES